MLKLLGISMMIICTSWIGCHASRKLILRKLFLNGYSHFLSFSRAQIRYAAISPIEILNKYESRGEFSKFLVYLKQNFKKKKNFKNAFKETLLEKKDNFGLTKSDINAILEFVEKLGTSDITNQLKHCDIHINFTESFLKDAEQKRKQMSKLYITLGVSSGLALSLLFL